MSRPSDRGDRPSTPAGGGAREGAAPTCELCATLVPQLRRLDHAYDDVSLRVVSSEDHQPTFAAFRVRSTPYVVAVDRDSIVRSRGVANTLDQVVVCYQLVEAYRGGRARCRPRGRTVALRYGLLLIIRCCARQGAAAEYCQHHQEGKMFHCRVIPLHFGTA